jgi:hypothetical protein
VEHEGEFKKFTNYKQGAVMSKYPDGRKDYFICDTITEERFNELLKNRKVQ